MNNGITFIELIEKLKNDELKNGQRFKTTYGTVLYVSAEDEGITDEMALRWEHGDGLVVVTSLLLSTTYSELPEYEPIDIDTMIDMLLSGRGEEVFYNVKESSDSSFPDFYHSVKNIAKLNENNVFRSKSLDKRVRFYKKMNKGSF